jgi:hypothetical protein
MHLHGNYNLAAAQQVSGHQIYALAAQKRAEEARRKTTESLFALARQEGNSKFSAPQEQGKKGQKGRTPEEGEFEHMFSALG